MTGCLCDAGNNLLQPGTTLTLSRSSLGMVRNPRSLTALLTPSTDYGESHYIGPIKGAQPNSQAWVDGFDHLPWLKLAGYFARAFKEGVYPRIEEDQIYMWARPHPKDAEAVGDKVPRPRNWELVCAVLLYQ